MKIKKIYEDNNKTSEDLLSDEIYKIIDQFVEIEHVKYTEDDYEISSKSKIRAANKIIEYLKQRGLIIYLDAEKYNL